MSNLGLSQAGLAERCGVSREAVSNWLSGKSQPRPNKLKVLSGALELELDSLFIAVPAAAPAALAAPAVAGAAPAPLIAGPCGPERARQLGGYLRELLPFLDADALFAPPVLEAPRNDADYARQAAARTRRRAGLGARAPLRREQLLKLHHEAGSILVPAIWPRAASARGQAVSVYLPEVKTGWAIFSLHTRNDEFNHVLAQLLGHRYALHALQGEAADGFADAFAHELLFPRDTAIEALDAILASPAPARQAEAIGAAYGISALSVVGQADRVAPACGRPVTGLDNSAWRAEWEAAGNFVPHAAYALFGSASLPPEAYLEQAGQVFGTPLFQAIAAWQRREGARAAALIAAVLQIGHEPALALSHALFGRAGGARY